MGWKMACSALFALTLFGVVGTSCTDGSDADDESTAACSVEITSIQFAADASIDEVNRVHRAASDVDGIRTVKRAEELGQPALVEVTTVDGVGSSTVAEIAASSPGVTAAETTCARG